MSQLAFDFEELIDEARLEAFAGVDVVERDGKQFHVRRVGKDIVFTPVGYVTPMLSCGVHEDTPAGREDCSGECHGFVCPSCGYDAGSFLAFQLNHDVYGTDQRDCVSQMLKTNHTWSAYRQLLEYEDSDVEDPYPFTNCWVAGHGHKESYKKGGWPVSCLVATLVEDYERCRRMRVPVDRLPPIDLQKLKEES